MTTKGKYPYDLDTPSIPNIAALSQLSVMAFADGAVLPVGYRNAVGDGGGGQFYWDSSDLSVEVAADTSGIRYIAPDGEDGSSGAWVRNISGHVNIKWAGAVGNYDTGTRTGTDDTDAINAAATFCANNNLRLFVPVGKYLISDTILFKRIDVDFESAQFATFYANTEITAIKATGSRNSLFNVNVWFDLLSDATTAVGIQFADNAAADATDQFSNCSVRQAYVRNAYRSYTCNSAGASGTVWNNTFINCRSDFAVERAWYFNSIVGSTTQTWINCMVDAVSATAKGWYTNNVDDVSWYNCQVDDMPDGDAIFVNLASKAVIENFRAEACGGTTSNGSLIYVNALSFIKGVKLQASTINVGAGNRWSVIKFGAGQGAGEVGDMFLESNVITSGDFYKVNTNAVNRKVNVIGADIQRSEIFIDSYNYTRIAWKQPSFAASDAAPSGAGTYEVGDLVSNVSSSPTNLFRRCSQSGTFGTLAGVTGSIDSGSRVIAVSSASSLRVGMYIDVVGVTGTKRIVMINGTNIYLNADSDATVSGAAVSYHTPLFATHAL